MNYKQNNKITVMVIVMVVIMVFLVLNLTKAQTEPEFLITWKANSYVPPDYQGKILPIENSVITMALELIENGRIADLSRNEIRWSIGDEVQSAFGKKSFSFQIGQFNRADQRIRVEILNYRGRILEKFIEIPLAKPEVFIQNLGNNAFEAKPYFFNVNNLKQLIFSWSVNGQNAAGTVENPQILQLKINGQPINPIEIKLRVSNLLNEIESASANFTL